MSGNRVMRLLVVLILFLLVLSLYALHPEGIWSVALTVVTMVLGVALGVLLSGD